MLFAARSATALHRLLDILPVFAGDDRIVRRFTLVPGSDFDTAALAAVERHSAQVLPWPEASQRDHDLILLANPKGRLELLRGTRVLLPHGAGFSKAVPTEGAPGAASGLDPAFLLSEGRALAALHALAHPSQVARLAAVSPEAAARAAVVGDPTLERVLASAPRRDAYRAALGTGARRLVVLTSTWGPESLLWRRPELPATLAARLPHDAYQTALVLHPNVRSELGDFELAERLAPALDAGMVMAGPYEEWAALLVAADAVVTDHGSTALYAAALDRPVVAAYDGGEELIPGSPMAELLDASPRLDDPGGVEAALAAHRAGTTRRHAESAFAEQGRALELLRAELYRLLELAPPLGPALPRPLPPPAAPTRVPAAFTVATRCGGPEGRRVWVERFPAHLPERLLDPPAERRPGAGRHLAAEHGPAGTRLAQSAGLLYRRAGPPPPGPHHAAWTAAGWTAHALASYPGCHTAAAVLSPTVSVARTRLAGGAVLAIHIEPHRERARGDRTRPPGAERGEPDDNEPPGHNPGHNGEPGEPGHGERGDPGRRTEQQGQQWRRGRYEGRERQEDRGQQGHPARRHAPGPDPALPAVPEAAATPDVVYPDPGAVLSAVHAWLAEQPRPPELPAVLRCELGGRAFRAHLATAAPEELAREL